MAEGWILLHKKITSWEWYQDVNACKLFFHLLLKANYKEKTWQGQPVKRGELISSRDKLAAETGLTVQQTRTAEMKLQSTNDIAIRSTNRFTIYFIVNYEEYQPEPTQATSDITNESIGQQQTNNKRISRPATTTKEGKEIKEEKELSKKEPSGELFAEAEIQFSYDWLPSVQKIFDEFKKLRKQKKKPLTAYAETLALKQLDEFHKQGVAVKEIIEQSILRGWDTFYPLKNNDANLTAPAGKLSFQELKELKHQQNVKEGEKLYEQYLAEQSK